MTPTTSGPSTTMVVVEQETAGTVTVVSGTGIVKVPPVPEFTGVTSVVEMTGESGGMITGEVVMVEGVFTGPIRLPPLEKSGFICCN